MRSRSELIRELSQALEPAPRLRGPHQLALLWWIAAWSAAVGSAIGASASTPLASCVSYRWLVPRRRSRSIALWRTIVNIQGRKRRSGS